MGLALPAQGGLRPTGLLHPNERDDGGGETRGQGHGHRRYSHKDPPVPPHQFPEPIEPARRSRLDRLMVEMPLDVCR